MLTTPGRLRPEAIEQLAEGARRLLSDAGPVVAVRAGTVLRAADGDPDWALSLRTGWAMSVRRLADGRRLIPGVHLPGDLIGLERLFYSGQPVEVVALTSVTYNVIDRAAVDRLNGGDGAVRLLQLALAEHLQLQDIATRLRSGSADQRLAGFYWSLYQRRRSKQISHLLSFLLPLTPEDMADHLGLNAVEVRRTMRGFRERSVAFHNERSVILKDLDCIRELAACFDPPSAEPIGSVRVTALRIVQSTPDVGVSLQGAV